MGSMRLTSRRAPDLKSFICRMKYSTGSPATSADSGWPWPDIRWHEPHAFGAGPATTRGAGRCSSGNQSGGFVLPAIAAASYSRALPGARTTPVIGVAGGCTASGTLNAQSGSPLGKTNGAGVCAAAGARSEVSIAMVTVRLTASGRIRFGLLRAQTPILSRGSRRLRSVRCAQWHETIAGDERLSLLRQQEDREPKHLGSVGQHRDTVHRVRVELRRNFDAREAWDLFLEVDGRAAVCDRHIDEVGGEERCGGTLSGRARRCRYGHVGLRFFLQLRTSTRSSSLDTVEDRPGVIPGRIGDRRRGLHSNARCEQTIHEIFLSNSGGSARNDAHAVARDHDHREGGAS